MITYRYRNRFQPLHIKIKRYRNVPLVDKVLSPEEANLVEPVSFEKVAKFILDECDELKNILPANFSNGFIQR